MCGVGGLLGLFAYMANTCYMPGREGNGFSGGVKIRATGTARSVLQYPIPRW